jgi:NADH-quinone oxidoreductase subunit L
MTFEPQHLAWVVLLAPALAAVAITLFGLRRGGLSAGLSIGAVLLAAGLSLYLFSREVEGRAVWSWISLSDGTASFNADLGLRLDGLSRLMLLVVTGVAAAIHIYSTGYMRGDPGVGRYFGGLSLFMFSMLGIVLADNFLMLFLFWELVGVSSYLLIGFWHERPAAADAAKKAFLTNRIGDFGFLLGIILVWAQLGTLNFSELESRLRSNPEAFGPLASAVGLLIFCGAVGKSAQFPLHVWLPDAMEGPTPVSALIHAATMVAAGVYMLCRVFFVLSLPGSVALDVIAWVGGGTALLAALIAVQQNDIKRILAYSTLSQLGYMVLAVGVSGESRDPSPAMYHLTTHACFKALLFLGAGSVIHAMHHEQDIWKMGALRRRLPITFWTFLIATLALCGIPPFSGFYSKDAILAAALHRSPALFAVGVGVAFLTAFYMLRLVLVAFGGPAKSQAPDAAHESPAVMTLPLLALAVPSALSGLWGVSGLLERHFTSAGGEQSGGWAAGLLAPFHHAPVAAVAGLLAAVAGISVAVILYRNPVRDPLPGLLGAVAGWMRDRFYFDELYAGLVRRTQETISGVADLVDRWVIDGVLVRGACGAIEVCGWLARRFQTGNVQTYSLLMVFGTALLVWWMIEW